MGMIPLITNDSLQQDFTIEESSRTHKLNLNELTISGYTDEQEAMIQAIFLILNIERYEYLIYSWNYGIELTDLFGQPTSFVIPELERRITEALIQDSRITKVDNFTFETNRNKVYTKFTAHTIFGDIEIEKVVTI
jgi:hypothetical protein